MKMVRTAVAERSRGNDQLYPAGLERIELPGVGHFVPREWPGVVGEVLKRMLQV